MRKVDVKIDKIIPLYGEPLSVGEFIRQIKEAEKGPFYSSNQVNEFLKKWKKKRP